MLNTSIDLIFIWLNCKITTQGLGHLQSDPWGFNFAI